MDTLTFIDESESPNGHRLNTPEVEVFKLGDAVHFLSDYGPIHRIKDDGKTRGIFVMELAGSMDHVLRRPPNLEDVLDPTILQGLTTGRLKLLWWHGWDAEVIRRYAPKIEAALIQSGIPREHFAYSSGSLTPQTSPWPKTWACPQSETFVKRHLTLTGSRSDCWVQLDDLSPTPPLKALCFNRSMGSHKIGWLAEMEHRGLLPHVLYSTGHITPNDLKWAPHHFGFRQFPEHLIEPKVLDVPIDVEPCYGLHPKWPWIQTGLSFVNESMVDDGDCLAITEKTFNAIANYHPFVILGCHGTLRKLREWGYETFESLWDESYDAIVDHNRRFQAVINLMESLIHRADLADLLLAARPIALHNHQRLLTRDTTQLTRQAIAELIEWTKT